MKNAVPLQKNVGKKKRMQMTLNSTPVAGSVQEQMLQRDVHESCIWLINTYTLGKDRVFGTCWEYSVEFLLQNKLYLFKE